MKFDNASRNLSPIDPNRMNFPDLGIPRKAQFI